MAHTSKTIDGKRRRNGQKGQAFFEFTFGIVMVVLLMLGMIQVFLWVGTDQVKQMQRHDLILRDDCGLNGLCPLQQVRPAFFSEDGFGDSVNGDILFGTPKARFKTEIN